MVQTDQLYRRGVKLMGNQFEFAVVAGDEACGKSIIDEGIAEVQRIEKLLTTYNDFSETNLINRNAGIESVIVSREVFELIERSKKISAITQGAFDITYGSTDKRLWNFDRQMKSLPNPKTARDSVRLINYRNVILDKEKGTVFLREKGMRIGFGGMGKGYAADKAKSVMVNAGATSGIVNASGDLTVWGIQPNGSPWTIGIADPDKRELPFASLQLNNASVATSGTYEKFVLIDDVKYSHTIDPKTGFPVRGTKSVTIICDRAEIADVMATPVMVMGIKVGLNLINQIKHIACIIIDDDDRIYTSDNINLTM